MHVKKIAKWGLALTSTLVLGGVVGPVGRQLLNTTDVVYAQEVLYYKVQHMTWDLDNTYKIVSEETLPIYPGETKTISSHAKVMDGEWVYDVSLEYDNDFTYDEVASGFRGIVVVMYTRPDNYNPEQPTETPVETPIEKPAEKPVEKPIEQPAEQPTEQPADQPVEQPVEKPAEVPVEQPVEQPAEQPVDTPTDKPVEQLTDASSLTDQTAGKVQVVAATDKKTVDKSAPSTTAVKPEEGSQTTTKTLPKTGDSSSMLLVLGGVLSGLSGLGLAATSRKRD